MYIAFGSPNNIAVHLRARFGGRLIQRLLPRHRAAVPVFEQVFCRQDVRIPLSGISFTAT